MKKKVLIITFLLFILLLIRKTKLKDLLLESTVRANTANYPLVLSNLKETLFKPKNILYYSLNNNRNDSLISLNEEVSVPVIEEESINPTVYIYNTHQTEEYAKTFFAYSVNPNVLIASYILKEHLKKYNIESLVETRSMKEYLNNNNMNYNDSYHASEYYARDALKNNPTIKYMIDIHRDSIKKEASSITIDNKPYTKIMFLMGYEHSKEENNTNFATSLHKIIEGKYRGLSRGVIDRRSYPYNGLYNPNLDTTSTLIEVGGVDSSLEEINNTLEALAWALNIYIKGGENE